jgi:hypothetical protein
MKNIALWALWILLLVLVGFFVYFGLVNIKDIKKSIDGREPTESTDGQSYDTQTWYEKKYLKTFKKWH